MNQPRDDRSSARDPLRPYALTTERQPAPIGLDEAAPLLGWQLAGEGRGRGQSAYRIRVAVDAAADGAGADAGADAGAEDVAPLWDSGWRTGDQTADIPYDGPALAARTRYVWWVRVADELGVRSGWSGPAVFETGLAPGRPDATDALAADWITAPGEAERAALPGLDTVDGANDLYRIRAVPEADPASGPRTTVFRKRFAARPDAVPAAARLLVAAEGTVEAAVNGVRVPHDGEPSPELAAALAAAPEAADGGQLLAVRVRTEDGTDPRLLAALTDGTPRRRPGPPVPHAAATDGSWRARRADGEEPDAGDTAWADPRTDDRDDTRWPRAAAEGRNGDGTGGYGRAPESCRPSPCLRRTFELPAPAARARLYATSLGIHELRLDGHRVGDEELAPGWTDYDHRVTYRTYDVTAQLGGAGGAGRHTLAAVLADGWYTGNLCIFGDQHYGRVRALRALLVVDHPDGTTTTLATAADGEWRAAHGAVRYADLQNGEVYDARLAAPGWDGAPADGGEGAPHAPEFDPTGWQPAVPAPAPPGIAVLAALTPPVRAQRELSAPLERRPDGTLLADFGENLSGRVRVEVRGAAGSRVLLRHAETLRHDGALYTENLRTARATDEYVLRGDPGGETWEPRFTTHGFRYCEITASPGTTVTSATAVALWAEMPATGAFACSHPGLTELHHNIGRSLRGNFLSVPTDCPQRDERMGWTGDIQVFAPTAAFHHDVRGFLRGWLRELRGAQHPDGAVPHTVPDVFARVDPDQLFGAPGAAGWGDAAVTVPAALLAGYADRRTVAESLESMARWLDHLRAHSEHGLRPADAFGDWLALSDTPKDLVATACFAHVARTAARLAGVLGDPARETEWSRLYGEVRAAFRERWVGGGGVLRPGTQTAYVLALHIGLLDPHETGPAADRLADEIASRGHHLTTGFLGTPWLLDALTDAGRLDTAHRLLLQDTYPSWLYPVSTGATTIWERWNSWSDSTGFADAAMTSFNHYAYGAVGDWMYRTLGGLAPAADGYRRVLVAPRPPEAVHWADTSLVTGHGTVSVGWRHEGDGFGLDVDLPPGVTAEVRVPEVPGAAGELRESGRPVTEAAGVRSLAPLPGCAAVVEIASGSYRFTLN